MTPRPTRALVGVGSNEGDRLGFLRFARRRCALIARTRVAAASAVYETAPVGGPLQGPFLNACLDLETTLEPRSLLAALTEIEDAAGRVRVVANGPRTLDLDLLLYGDVTSDEPRLTLPHPRFVERPFALIPAADVAGERRVPGAGMTIGGLCGARSASSDVARVAGPESWT